MVGRRSLFILLLALVPLLGTGTPSAAQDQPTENAIGRVVDQLGRGSATPTVEVLPEGLRLRTVLTQDVSGLEPGAAVRIGGLRVGTVRDVAARLPDAQTAAAEIATVVDFDLVGARLRIGERDIASDTVLLDTLEGLVNRGLRAGVKKPLAGLGETSLTLAVDDEAPKAAFDRNATPPTLPPGTDPEARLAEVRDRLFSELAEIPIDQLATDLTATMAILRTSAGDLPTVLDRLAGRVEEAIAKLEMLVAGPDTEALLVALRESAEALRDGVETLGAQGEVILGDVRNAAQSAGAAADQASATIRSLDQSLGGRATIWRDLDRLLDETTELVRNLRLFISYLQRHPEALITGKPGGPR